MEMISFSGFHGGDQTGLKINLLVHRCQVKIVTDAGQIRIEEINWNWKPLFNRSIIFF